MKIATQHYQDSVITPYGNNHWNGKEKIDISKEKDDAVILEISAKGKRAIQLKEKNEFEQDIVQVDKSADDLPAYSGMYVRKKPAGRLRTLLAQRWLCSPCR